MSREFFNSKTHAFLREESLRSEYSYEARQALEGFYNSLFREAPPLLREWHSQHHGIVMPFGSVLFGTAIKGISDIDEFGIYDGELSIGERNAVGNALLGNVLLGEETINQSKKLDEVLLAIRSVYDSPPITVGLLSQEQIIAAIRDPLYADPYFNSLPSDEDKLQTIAIVTLFVIPDHLVLPNNVDLAPVTLQNLRHHRLQVARALIRATENNPRYYDMQTALNKAYLNSFNRSLRKHPEEWRQLAQQIFAFRNKQRASKNPKRAADLLVRLRREPKNFPSPAQIIGWLSEI
ncbi:MAG: hypothetical protein HYV39_02235 [Candidatus Levybacteria bacterium]|nr:hypothetical protein [Candidatus Levybacteria bacterium]